MGSPATALNTTEQLRQLQSAGVTHVFRDALVLPDPVQAQPVQPVQSASPAQPASASQPVQSAPAVTPEQPREELPPPEFSAPWDQFWKMVKPGSSVIFTYAQLGLDLSRQGDPNRGQLMRTILGYLRWEKGTTSFWPHAVPVDGTMQADSDRFWQGVNALKANHVVCFGSDSLQAIAPGADPAQPVHKVNSVLVHALPAPEELMNKLPHDIRIAVDGLKSLSV